MNDYFKQDSDDNQTPDIFDKNGRAYPDVSALGENMQFFSNNQLKTGQGTSFAAPIFAGIIALINSELLTRGYPPLGWINPWIYENGQMFNDIIDGQNPYNKAYYTTNCVGFKAKEGWVCSHFEIILIVLLLS